MCVKSKLRVPRGEGGGNKVITVTYHKFDFFFWGGVKIPPPPKKKKRTSHTYIIMSSLFNQICNTNSSIVTNVKLLLLKPPFSSLYIVKGLFGAVFLLAFQPYINLPVVTWATLICWSDQFGHFHVYLTQTNTSQTDKHRNQSNI